MAPLRPALVLTGFMGAGKSTAAAGAAAALGTEAVDTDALLEQRLGGPIDAYFAAHGEAAFRAEEERLVVELLERAEGGVIALGGGALGSERVRAALRRHTTVLLDVDAATAWARVRGSDRPLARDRAACEALHAAREPVYLAAADAIVPGRRREALREALPWLLRLPEAPAGTRLLWASAASGSHPVWIGRGLLGAGVWPLPGESRRFVVTDEHVAPLHAAALPTHARLELAAGEEHKTVASAERAWRWLAAHGARRGDHVAAVGGGVVGDLAGFVAATYQRGMPVVQVPTTLVAQVDSAYGGKTGVDLPEAKNYVGAYHQPAGVVADTATLATLPQAERAAGYAEVVKTALIAGGALWERVAAGARDDDDVVVACARCKLAVVAEDERDAGRRQVLNLGHTVGHAIETATGYARYRHGEAVALGLLAARGLPTRMDPAVDLDAVEAAVQRDKKRRAGQVGFVLVEGPGHVRT
ncbi:MAG TPA: bifunctional shikimate kinase/3-dehydroquinate synthase, partial [Solirubrobacteraceae bacterium]|nr:bifunctional shikimate kinase/3-dehydroquinate synthase [Solirubrobacteraceae bacterium]